MHYFNYVSDLNEVNLMMGSTQKVSLFYWWVYLIPECTWFPMQKVRNKTEEASLGTYFNSCFFREIIGRYTFYSFWFMWLSLPSCILQTLHCPSYYWQRDPRKPYEGFVYKLTLYINNSPKYGTVWTILSVSLMYLVSLTEQGWRCILLVQ